MGLVAEEDALGGSSDPDRHRTEAEKPIGRRAFLGLLAAGGLAFVFGRDAFSHLVDTLSGDQSTSSATTMSRSDGAASWTLVVEGLVRKPFTLSSKDLMALPQAVESPGFTCVGGWRVKPREWKGVRLRELLDRARTDVSATHVVFHSTDAEYTDSLTVEEALSDDVLLAHTMDGEVLARDHGGPVRLVAPGRYGYKYVKSVTKVELIAAGPEGYKGYWESRGYPVDGLIKS
jgi:DMSO/TMAO reductase YedYZ molybdopterin-dependent catalytic subunit